MVLSKNDSQTEWTEFSAGLAWASKISKRGPENGGILFLGTFLFIYRLSF
ncbi:MAG: hypothetical protein ABFD91_18225 [Anaerohalosphaeraceae bacterium]